MVIREQELDGFEAGRCGRGKALRESDFVEHHGQVGGKSWHGTPRN
jgi:hypothetical protein